MLTDFKSRFIEMFGTLADPKYGLIKVADLVSKDIEKVSKKYDSEDIIDYIDISLINKESRSIMDTVEYAIKDAPSRAQQCVITGDILLSNVRPNLKTLAIVNSKKNNLVCSSGFTVLRCTDSCPEYLTIAITDDYFTDKLVKKANGSNYPAVTSKDVYNSVIPSASIELQKQFAEFVQQVDKSKVIKESVKSRFIEMFGNLDINDKQWKMSTIGESAKVPLHYGSTASAVDYDSETRYVRITDIGSDGKLNDDFKSPSTYDSSYLLNKGDILFARSGSVGVTYLFDEDYKSIFAGYLIRFIPDDEKLDPEFTYQFTRSSYCQGILVGSKRGGVQKNVNAKQLSAIPIPLPPMDLQKEFVDFVHQVDKSKVGVLSTILLINIYINTEA